jgi:hypothetical protein
MTEFDHILNWKLLRGSHEFPGSDGGTCINEAAIVAAGLPYREIQSVYDMPRCFSPLISQYVLALNDGMTDRARQRLIPYIPLLAGTADSLHIEEARAEYLALRAVQVFAATALNRAGLCEHAGRCRLAQSPSEAEREAARGESAAYSQLDWPANLTAMWARRAVRSLHTRFNEFLVEERVAVAQFAANAAQRSNLWDEAIGALDGVLAIGRKTGPIPLEIAAERLERAKPRLEQA